MFEWFTGLSYRFVRNWSGGLEFWNHHEFADATVHEHSATLSDRPFIMAANAGGPPWIPSSVTNRQAFSQDNKEFAAYDYYIFSITKILRKGRIGFNF
jgi:hypothetical protein